ncbi:MAG TPA: ATP-binding protein [Candidatus Limiplasma sp.]|nr:ATP-binding protein [Candidatus Limiplasma sp.]
MEIIKGKVHRAQKVVLYGPEGIGKTSMASKFPEPLFCDTEGGSTHMDIARTPAPTSWNMLLATVKEVAATPGLCKTFVLDTADWAERLCIEHVCSTHDKKGVEDFGYGKGYVFVYEEFGKLLNLLNDVIDHGIHVVITAHAQLRKFEQPDELGSYDRYELKLSKKTGAQVADMLKEWCDMLLFLNYKTIVVNVDGNGATKGKNKAQGGQRVMYTTHTPSWDAKNRHGLPDELPMDYGTIAAHFGNVLQSAPVDTPVQVQKPPLAPPVMEPQTEAQGEDELPPDQSISNIPLVLRDLMKLNNVTEEEIMYVVGQKGYYPGDTPIENYDPAFVRGVLIAAWPQVEAAVLKNREDGRLTCWESAAGFN